MAFSNYTPSVNNTGGGHVLGGSGHRAGRVSMRKENSIPEDIGQRGEMIFGSGVTPE
jgi:hypothetical protein